MQFDIAVIDFLDPVPDVHSPEKPFCYDAGCSCHEDDLLIYQVLLYVQDGLMTPHEAVDFVMGKGI
jgi:hypothetical protein